MASPYATQQRFLTKSFPLSEDILKKYTEISTVAIWSYTDKYVHARGSWTHGTGIEEYPTANGLNVLSVLTNGGVLLVITTEQGEELKFTVDPRKEGVQINQSGSLQKLGQELEALVDKWAVETI